MRHLPYVAAHRGAHFKIVPADAPSDAVDHGQAAAKPVDATDAGTDARTVDAADARTDARTDAPVDTAVDCDAADARTDAWPIATADAVDVVCRRRHLVLRLVLAERLRVRRPEAQAL